MKLIQVKLKNWRCYKEEVCIDLGDLVVFVGKNDSGKSSVFDALDLFFDDGAVPDKDDVCVNGEGTEVRLACVFADMPSEVVIDAQHTTTLLDEYLLSGQGYLEIVKIYDCSLAKPKCSGVYARAAHPTTDGYADLLALTNRSSSNGLACCTPISPVSMRQSMPICAGPFGTMLTTCNLRRSMSHSSQKPPRRSGIN